MTDQTNNTVSLLQLEWLKILSPLDQLQEKSRQALYKNSQHFSISRGDKIRASDEYHWIIYLYRGDIDIINQGKILRKLKSGSALSKKPVFHEKEHHEYAFATSDCELLRIDREYYNALIDQELIEGEQLETIEVDEKEGYLFNSITQAFNHGKIELPSLPEIAVKVKDAVSNKAKTGDDIARIIEADPAIAARLIQVANSPIKRGIEPVTNIRSAVMRIGLEATRDLILCFSVKQLFTAKSTLLKKRMHILYEDSTEVAAIAYAIAKHATRLDPDDMLLAGLVHEIGVIPILSYMDSTGLIVEDLSQVESIINDLKSVVGNMVITSWGLSSDLLNIVENVHNWTRSEHENVDSCDVILVAQIYHHLQHHQVKGIPALENVPAIQKIFNGDEGFDLLQKILEEAGDEVQEVKRLLKN